MSHTYTLFVPHTHTHQVWGEDRTKALDLLDRQLNAMHIVGLPTNINFVKACAEHPKFIEGGVTTGFIEENFDELTPFVSTTPLPSHGHRVSAAFAIAGCLVRESAEARAFNAQFDEDTTSPMGFGDAHRINHTLSRKVELARLVRGEECSFEAVLGMDGAYQDCSSFSLTFPAVASDAAEATAFEVDVDSTGDFEYDPLESSISLTLALEDAQYSGKVIFDGLDVHVFLDSEIPIEQGVIGQEPARHVIFKRPHTSYGEDDGDARISAVAPMSGKIVKVLVASGDAVIKGDPLVIMEAMKMEHVVRAGQDGIIDRCLYDVEGFVEGGRPVVTFVEEE
jgi:3-methylcrotonyl-CoA carboxylase alpha subunit